MAFGCGASIQHPESFVLSAACECVSILTFQPFWWRSKNSTSLHAKFWKYFVKQHQHQHQLLIVTRRPTNSCKPTPPEIQTVASTSFRTQVCQDSVKSSYHPVIYHIPQHHISLCSPLGRDWNGCLRSAHLSRIHFKPSRSPMDHPFNTSLLVLSSP